MYSSIKFPFYTFSVKDIEKQTKLNTKNKMKTKNSLDNKGCMIGVRNTVKA